VIVYVDSSVLARAYLADEEGHADARALLDDADVAIVTATWTHVEVTGALARAARHGQRDAEPLLTVLDADVADGGRVTLLRVPPLLLEHQARMIVRRHPVRALDALHLAVADQTLERLAEPGEPTAFATRDAAQAAAAEALGLALA
jgi:predicted nucleic acid-binding protein